MISKLRVEHPGFIRYEHTDYGSPISASGRIDMLIIQKAWDKGCDFEQEADGYGEGQGTHGDWSGIRDSSEEAIAHMLEKALNFIFPG